MIDRLIDKILRHPPKPAAFAEIILRQARLAGLTKRRVYEPEQFRIAQETGQYLFLANAYHEYTTAKRSERRAVVLRYVQILLNNTQAHEPSLDQAQPSLIPVIRNLGMLIALERERLSNDDTQDCNPQQFRAFGDDCVELLAIDTPETTQTLTAGPPDVWGLSLDQALAIAHGNLREATDEAWEELAPGLYLGGWHDGYDPSRALLPDVLERAPIKGRPVFMMPTRDTLLLCGDRDEAAVHIMMEIAHSAFDESGRWVSAQAYSYDNYKKPIAYLPPWPEARARLADLGKRLFNEDYASQKDFLDKLHQQQDRDIFVAGYFLRRSPAGNQDVSWSVWSKGVDTLLPKTDRLAFNELEDNGNPMMVDWAASLPVIGHLLEEEAGHYPPRFRTLGFPDTATLAALVRVEE